MFLSWVFLFFFMQKCGRQC